MGINRLETKTKSHVRKLISINAFVRKNPVDKKIIHRSLRFICAYLRFVARFAVRSNFTFHEIRFTSPLSAGDYVVLRQGVRHTCLKHYERR
jgi:hypothetical protein